MKLTSEQLQLILKSLNGYMDLLWAETLNRFSNAELDEIDMARRETLEAMDLIESMIEEEVEK